MKRFLKTVHGWLGVLILPWVVLAGLTGLYENHPALVLGVLAEPRLTPALLADLPPAPQDAAAVAALAAGLLPAPVPAPAPAPFLGRPGFRVVGEVETLQIDQATGARLRITPYQTVLSDAAGRVLSRQWHWGRILQRLHKAGWLGARFGTWPADLAAGALVVFGLSGLWLFFAPRVRRWRNRRARGA